MQIVHKNQGFTLIEMMTGLVILIILTAAGIPGFINYARNGSRDDTSKHLFADMYYARSEAIKRKSAVYLCRSADAHVANPACGGGAKNWSTGWLVFADGAGGTTGKYDAGIDTLLKVGYPASDRIHVMSNAKADSKIAFLSDGSLDTAYAPSLFAICDDRDGDGTDDPAYGQDLVVGAMGRPEITNKILNCAP